MKRGGNILCSVAVLAIAACTGTSGELQVRPTPTPLAAGERPVPFRIAEGWGQLSLGNVGLALESFRKALRDDSSSIDSMTGIAACYDRMARFDLSRRHYEAALAIAPGDTRLLTAFAASLALQGRAMEAASVRKEINQRVAAAAPTGLRPATPLAASVAKPIEAVVLHEEPKRPARPELTTAPKAPPAAVVARVASAPPAPAASPMTRVAAAPPAPAATEVATAPRVPPVTQTTVASPTAALTRVSATPVEATEVPAATVPASIPAAQPAIGRSVTVALPPARSVAEALPAKPGVEVPAQVARAAVAKPPVSVKAGARLERMSLTEMALITTPGPQWRALTVGRTARSATVKFVPLRQAAARPGEIRLLNAARVDRLAARTRAYLIGRGWRRMPIGNAQAVRDRSIIFYPAGRRTTAQTLSRQFGFAIAQRAGTRHITVLLGRDAARVAALRAKG